MNSFPDIRSLQSTGALGRTPTIHLLFLHGSRSPEEAKILMKFHALSKAPMSRIPPRFHFHSVSLST